MGSYIAFVYFIAHVPLGWSAIKATYWEKFAEKNKPQKPKHQYLVEWAATVIALLAFDLLFLFPAIDSKYGLGAISGILPFTLFKFFVLSIFLSAKPERRR